MASFTSLSDEIECFRARNRMRSRPHLVTTAHMLPTTQNHEADEEFEDFEARRRRKAPQTNRLQYLRQPMPSNNHLPGNITPILAFPPPHVATASPIPHKSSSFLSFHTTEGEPSIDNRQNSLWRRRFHQANAKSPKLGQMALWDALDASSIDASESEQWFRHLQEQRQQHFVPFIQCTKLSLSPMDDDDAMEL